MAKQNRFDCKQRHGSSRKNYFAQATTRIAKNKAKRIAAHANFVAKKRAEKIERKQLAAAS